MDAAVNEGPVTWLDLTKEVASEFGVTLTDADADSVLWGATGFPGFWTTDDPIEECRTQLRQFFALDPEAQRLVLTMTEPGGT